MKNMYLSLLLLSAQHATARIDFSLKNTDAATINRLSRPTTHSILTSVFSELKSCLTYFAYTESSNALINEYLDCFNGKDPKDMSTLELLGCLDDLYVVHKKHLTAVHQESDESLALTADILVNHPNTLAARNIYVVYAVMRLFLLPISVAGLTVDSEMQSIIDALTVLKSPTTQSIDEIKQGLNTLSSWTLPTKSRQEAFKNLYIASIMTIKANIQAEREQA